MACIKSGQDHAFLAYLARQVGVQEIHERIVLPTVAPHVNQNKLLVSHVHPMDHSPPGSSLHEIHQARILEQVAISFFRGSS